MYQIYYREIGEIFYASIFEKVRDNITFLKELQAPTRELLMHKAKVFTFEESTGMRVHTDGEEAVDAAMAATGYQKPEIF